MIERDPSTGQFRPGPELLRMASKVTGSADIRRASYEPMIALAERWREAVTLCMHTSQGQVLYFDRAPSPKPLQYVVPLGETAPLYVGSSGRAILAYLPDERIEQVLGEITHAYSKHTGLDAAGIRADLASVRERGYAVSQEERVAGAVGISAPIFDMTGGPVGSLLVAFPLLQTLTPGDIASIGNSVREQTANISLRLGWAGFGLSASGAKVG